MFQNANAFSEHSTHIENKTKYFNKNLITNKAKHIFF